MSAPTSPWPEQLDAVIAAPEHHHILLENAIVRVLETKILPGETVKLHTEKWPTAIYFLSIGHFVRRDEQGNVVVDTRQTPDNTKAGDAVWSPPIAPHTLENVGSTVIHVISVGVKSDAAKPES
ncbi:MAG: hypothetical protein ACREJD_01120 [Phycisphaerales bacterium]